VSFNWKFPKYSANWEKLADECKRRDGYTCKVCGARGFKANTPGTATLQACHIKSKRDGGRDLISNLITKCVKCHSQESGHGHMKANPRFQKQIKTQKKKWTF